MRPDEWQKERMGIWVGPGLEDREGKGREEGKRGVCFPQTNLFYKKKCKRREGGVRQNVAFCCRDENETENLCLMISLLACTQTYKNNTALISTWRHVIITVLQTFKNKRIQTKSNMMEHLHHSWKNQLFPLAWNEARPETQLGPKEVSTFFSLKKKNHLTHVHQSGGWLLTS